MKRLQIAVVLFLIFAGGASIGHAANDIATSTTYVTTYTSTTSVSHTTTTTTYTLSTHTVETTLTTTSVTATHISSSWESITLLTTATVQSTLWFTETTSTTVTVIETSTYLSPTVAVPTTRVTTVNTTIYSPTLTITSTVSSKTKTTTTTTLVTTITTNSPTVTLTSTTRIVTTIMPLRMLYPSIMASAANASQSRGRGVRSTFAGAEFMRAFDVFYSSFNPSFALAVRSSHAMDAAVRLFLYPIQYILWTSLAIFHAFGFAVEAGMIVAEVFSSALVGITYVTPIALGIKYLFRKRDSIKKPIEVSSAGLSKSKRNRHPTGVSR